MFFVFRLAIFVADHMTHCKSPLERSSPLVLEYDDTLTIRIALALYFQRVS